MKPLATVLLIVSLGAVGCGPIVSGVGTISADIQLKAAKSAGADTQAVYEYVAAHEYLAKAREEIGYSDFAAARKYANKALEFAKVATRRAEDAGKREASDAAAGAAQ